MGIRPHLEFVCGINDVIDSDLRCPEGFKLDIYEQKVPGTTKNFPDEENLFLDYSSGGIVYYDQVFLQGNPTGHFPGSFPVVGYVIARGNEDLARGIAEVLGWGTDEKIIVRKPLPNPDKWFAGRYAEREGKDVVESANLEHRWMETFTPWYSDLYYKRTIHLLHHAGWTGVTRAMLKFMLVLYWS